MTFMELREFILFFYPIYKLNFLEYCYFKKTHGDFDYVDPVQNTEKICYDLLEEYKDKSDGHIGKLGVSHDRMNVVNNLFCSGKFNFYEP